MPAWMPAARAAVPSRRPAASSGRSAWRQHNDCWRSCSRGAASPPLDVGCGSGGDLASSSKRGGRRMGSPASTCSPRGWLRRASRARRLSFGSATTVASRFGMAASTSRPPRLCFRRSLTLESPRAVAEMERVVRPGGVLLIYDFVIRKPTNRNVIAMPLSRVAALRRPPDGSVPSQPTLSIGRRPGGYPTGGSRTSRCAPLRRRHRLSYWRKPQS